MCRHLVLTRAKRLSVSHHPNRAAKNQYRYCASRWLWYTVESVLSTKKPRRKNLFLYIVNVTAAFQACKAGYQPNQGESLSEPHHALVRVCACMFWLCFDLHRVHENMWGGSVLKPCMPSSACLPESQLSILVSCQKPRGVFYICTLIFLDLLFFLSL